VLTQNKLVIKTLAEYTIFSQLNISQETTTKAAKLLNKEIDELIQSGDGSDTIELIDINELNEYWK